MGLLDGIGKFISGASPLASGIIGAITGSRQNELQRESAMELARYGYARDLEMWNRANVYNSPEEQMKRLTAAGLNPNLVYGNGAAQSQAAQLPKFNAPNLQFGIPNPAEGLPSTIGMFQDFQIKQQQLDNLKAQQKAIEATTANKLVTNEYLPESLRRKNTLLFQKQQGGVYSGDMAREALYSTQLKNQLLKEGMNFQLEYMSGRSKHQQAQIAKISQDTELQKLKTDWFVTSLIGKFGLDVAKTIVGATGLGKVGKMMGQINQNRRTIPPRYNSAESWRRLGY